MGSINSERFSYLPNLSCFRSCTTRLWICSQLTPEPTTVYEKLSIHCCFFKMTQPKSCPSHQQQVIWKEHMIDQQFRDDNTKAGWGWKGCPRSHSCTVVELRMQLEPHAFQPSGSCTVCFSYAQLKEILSDVSVWQFGNRNVFGKSSPGQHHMSFPYHREIDSHSQSPLPGRWEQQHVEWQPWYLQSSAHHGQASRGGSDQDYF